MDDGSMPAVVLSVAAGKGGTGKTFIATSLAVALAESGHEGVTLVDCDVEEPNVHVFLRPEFTREHPVSLRVPEVIEDACDGCARCAEVCRANALAVMSGRVLTFHDLCSGCGACVMACPNGALREVSHRVGQVSVGRSLRGPLVVEGRLDVGLGRTSSVIRAARSKAPSHGITIIDAPPGTACPMQGAIRGSDACLLVTEPTPFGLSDLTCAIETCRALGVRPAVIINRAGIGDAAPMQLHCREQDVPVLLEIPHQRALAVAYAEGRLLIDAAPEWTDPLIGLIEGLQSAHAGGSSWQCLHHGPPCLCRSPY